MRRGRVQNRGRHFPVSLAAQQRGCGFPQDRCQLRNFPPFDDDFLFKSSSYLLVASRATVVSGATVAGGTTVASPATLALSATVAPGAVSVAGSGTW